MGSDIDFGRMLDERAIRDIAISLGNHTDLKEGELASAISAALLPGFFEAYQFFHPGMREIKNEFLCNPNRLNAQIAREEFVETVEQMLGAPISYPRLSRATHFMKGTRVKVRASNNRGSSETKVGTITKFFNISSSHSLIDVIFADGSWVRASLSDLEFAIPPTPEMLNQASEEDERIFGIVKDMPLEDFLSGIESQVLSAIKKRQGNGMLVVARKDPGFYPGWYSEGSIGFVVERTPERLHAIFSVDPDKRWSGSSFYSSASLDVSHHSVKFPPITEQAAFFGGAERYAHLLVMRAAMKVVESTDAYRYSHGPSILRMLEDVPRKIFLRALKELVQDGLILELGNKTYGVDMTRGFELTGGELARAYSNPQLYSSPDMFSPIAERRPHVLRLELTQGCDHGACTFCTGYRRIQYAERTYDEFVMHYAQVKQAIGHQIDAIKRVFIGGGNALAAVQGTLLNILDLIRRELKPSRIAIYGRADSIIEKGETALADLKEAGLSLVYLGIESGSQAVLDYVCKKETVRQMEEACVIARNAGLDLSVMIMPGLGGLRFYDEHVAETVRLLNNMRVRYITFMTVNPSDHSVYSRIMAREMAEGINRPLTELEVVEQVRDILDSLNPNGQKVGMFYRHIDRVGQNPFGFNQVFNRYGKQEALSACNEHLKRLIPKRAVA